MTGRAMIETTLFPVNLSPSCAAIATYVRRAADLFGAAKRTLDGEDPSAKLEGESASFLAYGVITIHIPGT